MKVRLKIKVEYEGAVFYARPLDGIIPAVLSALSEDEAKLLLEKNDFNILSVVDLPEKLISLLIEVFNESLIGWENIENDETGEKLEFNEENVKMFPSYIKLEVGSFLIKEMLVNNEKKE